MWGVADNEVLLGSVGALHRDKGQAQAILSLAQLRAEFPACRLLLAGSGPARRELEELARQANVATAVRFAGFVEDVKQIYCALDVFVFPAVEEGLGTSLLAAMAHGLPVVAMRSSVAAEVVEDACSGVLVPDRDPATLATAIRRLLADPVGAGRLGAQARRVVEAGFTADHMVESTLRLYHELTGDREPQ